MIKRPGATLAAVKHLLDYVTTYPNDGIIYRTSKMILSTHSDAGFNNELNASSQLTSTSPKMTPNHHGMAQSSPLRKSSPSS